METKNLGHSNILVSKICLGTMTFGQQNSEAEGHEQLNYAFDEGINFLDTAEMYAVPASKETQGLTEKYIGTWLKDQTRDKIIVATKVTGPSFNMTYIRNPLDFNASSIDLAIDGSLKRLQTDYVDLYQLHWPERMNNRFGIRGIQSIQNDPWENNFSQVIQKMNNLVQKGKIRTWGLSNETPWGVMSILNLCDKNGWERPVSIQNAYSLVNRTYEVGMAEVSLRENIGLLAYSPLAMGMLSGKYHLNKDLPENRMNQFKNNYPRYESATAKKAIGEYVRVAQSHDLSPTSMSLAFVNDQEFMTSNIIGATNLQQLKENISSAKLTLSQSCINDINKVHESISNPCP